MAGKKMLGYTSIYRAFVLAIAPFIGCVLGSALPTAAQWEGKEKQLEAVKQTFGDPPELVRLDPTSRVWADRKNKRLIVDGYIALDNGPLEMFACIAGTKEHESIVAVFSKAYVIHAGLLAVGAKQGRPVQWEPEYQPPTGSEIQVFVLWKDEEGKRHHIDSRKWIREIGTEDKTLEPNFVFAGSMMYKDPETGKEFYQAESGDLICVSNFTTATLDVPIKSLETNSLLMFATFSERIPKRGTPVRLVLQVVEPTRSADTRNDATASEKPSDATAQPEDFEKLTEPPK
jgi:hypothetical protein